MMQHPSDYSRNNQSNVIYINGFSKDDRKCTEKKTDKNLLLQLFNRDQKYRLR